MRIPINDLKRHHAPLAGELAAAVNRVLASGWYILGPEVEAFEREFARYCGVEHCAGVGNGTDALELALGALGIGPGTEVATVANAGMYSTTAILRVGARPLYIDVDGRSMTMSPAALDAAISGGPEGCPAAVIVTHLYGQMAEIEELLAIAGRKNIPVIEDCAQAHGAERAGRKAGSRGKLGCFSFYPTKNLGAAGDGGAVVTADAALAAKVRALRQYGWTAKYRSTVAGAQKQQAGRDAGGGAADETAASGRVERAAAGDRAAVPQGAGGFGSGAAGQGRRLRGSPLCDPVAAPGAHSGGPCRGWNRDGRALPDTRPPAGILAAA